MYHSYNIVSHFINLPTILNTYESGLLLKSNVRLPSSLRRELVCVSSATPLVLSYTLNVFVESSCGCGPMPLYQDVCPTCGTISSSIVLSTHKMELLVHTPEAAAIVTCQVSMWFYFFFKASQAMIRQKR